MTGPPGAHNPANLLHAEELARAAERTGGVHLLHRLGVRVNTGLLADLYALADLLLLPSANEGFGIPILEAGAVRLPIVCSDLPPLREIAGGAARYVAPDAGGPAIASAVRLVLARSETSRLKRVAAAYSWSRVASLTTDLILGPQSRLSPRKPAR